MGLYERRRPTPLPPSSSSNRCCAFDLSTSTSGGPERLGQRNARASRWPRALLSCLPRPVCPYVGRSVGRWGINIIAFGGSSDYGGFHETSEVEAVTAVIQSQCRVLGLAPNLLSVPIASTRFLVALSLARGRALAVARHSLSPYGILI